MSNYDFRSALNRSIQNTVSQELGLDRIYQGTYNPKRRKYNCPTEDGTIRSVRYRAGRDTTKNYSERRH